MRARAGDEAGVKKGGEAGPDVAVSLLAEAVANGAAAHRLECVRQSVEVGPVAGAFIVVGLQNQLADKVGSWVQVIMGAIFVVCVLAFRRGIVGELMALFSRKREP